MIEKNILILLMGSIGDVLRALPVAARIKSLNPDVRVSWLIEPKSQDIAKLSKNVDEIIVFKRDNLVNFFQTAFKLSSYKFDLVLDLQRHLKSGFFSWCTRSKRRIGFHPRNAKEFNWLFNTETIEFYDGSLSKIWHYQKFLDYLQLKPQSPLDFGIEIKEQAFLLPDKYLSLVLGSSWESKDWIYNQELVQLILKNSTLNIVLLGDKSKLAEAVAIENNLKSDRVKNLVGQTKLSELPFILKNSVLAVGPDSGPGHIASAVGTRYIGLFGPTSPDRVAPYGSEGLVIQSKISCAGCNFRSCPGLSKLCMQLIRPELVWKKISDEILRTEGDPVAKQPLK